VMKDFIQIIYTLLILYLGNYLYMASCRIKHALDFNKIILRPDE
jgi:hypothetical protein